jgi:hypothetical protein
MDINGRCRELGHETLRGEWKGRFRANADAATLRCAAATWSSFIRTVTVGSGIEPDLLTPRLEAPGARGLELSLLPPVGNSTPP